MQFEVIVPARKHKDQIGDIQVGKRNHILCEEFLRKVNVGEMAAIFSINGGEGVAYCFETTDLPKNCILPVRKRKFKNGLQKERRFINASKVHEVKRIPPGPYNLEETIEGGKKFYVLKNV